MRVATVVNFPAGTDAVAAVEAETRRALADGADEIDLVVPWRALADGRPQAVTEMVAAIRAVCRSGDARRPSSRPASSPTPDLIRAAAEAALAGGADFLKTSTGKVAVNATPEAARILLEAIRAERPRRRTEARRRRPDDRRTPASTSRSATRSWGRAGRRPPASASAPRASSTALLATLDGAGAAEAPAGQAGY